MRTVAFRSVLESAGRRAGLDVSAWDAATQANVVDFLNSWVKKAWEWEFWPELTVLEQRAYRDAYDASRTYAAPAATTAAEVWFPAAQKYYQTLQAGTGNAPATLAGTIWTANGPYWAESLTAYTGSDWTATTVYAAGVVVRNPSDNRYYQCITAHTSGGTFDATKFGILTPFERYVALDQAGQTPIGEVRRVTTSNPRTNPRFPGDLTFVIDDKGILPAPRAGAQVWVEFRIRPSQFATTATYTGGYTFGLGDVVLFTSTGDCYLSLASGNVGHSPDSSPTWWRKQEFPYLLAEAVKQGTYAEILRMDGNNEKADQAEAKAYEKLSQASDVALASQGQYDRAAAMVY